MIPACPGCLRALRDPDGHRSFNSAKRIRIPGSEPARLRRDFHSVGSESDLEAPRAGEEQATARCRVGYTGPKPSPQGRDTAARSPSSKRSDPRHQTVKVRRQSRLVGRTVGPEPREGPHCGAAAGHWQGSFRSHRRAEATAGSHRQGFAVRPAEPMDGGGPQRSRNERSEVRIGAVKGSASGHPDEHRRCRDGPTRTRTSEARRGCGSGQARDVPLTCSRRCPTDVSLTSEHCPHPSSPEHQSAPSSPR